MVVVVVMDILVGGGGGPRTTGLLSLAVADERFAFWDLLAVIPVSVYDLAPYPICLRGVGLCSGALWKPDELAAEKKSGRTGERREIEFERDHRKEHVVATILESKSSRIYVI